MKKSRLWTLLLLILAILAWGTLGMGNNDDSADADVAVEDDADADVAVDADADVAVEDDADADVAVEDDADSDVAVEDDADGLVAINTTASKLEWEGRSAGKSHNGDVAIQSGSVKLEWGNIVAGEFVVDMESINALDIDSDSLDNHLKADDFFDVEAYPTARLAIKSVEWSTATAELTIKDVTDTITFDIQPVDGWATASFSIDSSNRNVWDGIKWALVADDIDFDIMIAY